jgi:hypothetical protein
MSLTPEEINALLAKSRDKKFRKKTDAQLEGENKRIYSLKEYRKQNPVTDEQKEQIALGNKQFRLLNPMTDIVKKQIGDKLRGKTLEELIGEEKAAEGRLKRSAFHKGRKRPVEVGLRVAATRKAIGSYDSPTHGMRGKTHKEDTKAKQSTKAQVRQDLKKKLGLGRNDSIPKDILLAEYKRLKL